MTDKSNLINFFSPAPCCLKSYLVGQLLFLHLVLQCFPRQLHNKEKTNVNNLKLVYHFITERMKTNDEVKMADKFDNVTNTDSLLSCSSCCLKSYLVEELLLLQLLPQCFPL